MSGFIDSLRANTIVAARLELWIGIPGTLTDQMVEITKSRFMRVAVVAGEFLNVTII